ncbi:hypothetical protein C2857_002225 [Epichloe festucae Fl1]|uniref:Uncharacterized protein n=1 Tax=Epichloe festucae (strain Fl1) TaxID=877507 RepID=A0A7S9KUH9_EPIFF|nr:hypothetical protein C2857_002225 [Epichloe festucae Fl1]
MASSSDIKIVRSIPALEKMIGRVAAFEEHKAMVREDMKRTLTPEERQHYRGITHTGEPWLMFDQLYNVNTTEDLIRAEEFGVFHSPVDCPGESYLFACDVGLAAGVHPQRAAQLKALSEGEEGTKKTREELHTEYKESKLETKNWDKIFDEVAGDYVKWASGHE